MTTAKVFITGGSQAVRLPKAFRFKVAEVLIERQPDGALLLRPKPKLPLGDRLRSILQALPDDPAFEHPEQPPLERDTAWWAQHGFRVEPRKTKSRIVRQPKR